MSSSLLLARFEFRDSRPSNKNESGFFFYHDATFVKHKLVHKIKTMTTHFGLILLILIYK